MTSTIAKPHAIPSDMENLHHTGRFTVGDMIRAYDFPHRRDCYYEGAVLNPFCVRNGVQCYEIRLERVAFDGKVKETTQLAYVPHETFLTENDSRIEAVA